MQPPLVLRAEPASSGNLLPLLLSVPEHSNIGADRTPIAAASNQIKFDPLIPRIHVVLIQQNRSLLVRDHRIQRAVITKIRQRHRAAVEPVRHTHELSYFSELAGA